MPTPGQLAPTFTQPQTGPFRVSLATTESDVEASQRLRYAVFCEEMGIDLPKSIDERDVDEFDPHCLHLLVADSESGRLVGSTRLLFGEGVKAAGMFCSESEFELDRILALPGRFMEVGRTCIHADHRTGTALRTLWSGIAREAIQNDIDYLIGCASLTMDDGGVHAQAVVNRVREKHFTPQDLRVAPRLPLSDFRPLSEDAAVVVPALLKSYLRLGAKVGGEACWNPELNVADVLVLLHREHLEPRYVRNLLECAQAI